ncbi:MAG: hypothetical protein AAB426_14930 [Myxococcota bacterium]
MSRRFVPLSKEAAAEADLLLLGLLAECGVEAFTSLTEPEIQDSSQLKVEIQRAGAKGMAKPSQAFSLRSGPVKKKSI